ncbi:uncharacterized protein LOC128534691 [Clarias gariepinus]|uniref:uncharacterized protein LOC128534691 n=1 Tax=Clarias gariepinus TaxID=13013 RepID=UPI00234D61C8|nr:uncharacterized protein LOC128534691 [Clarias gariepinus]
MSRKASEGPTKSSSPADPRSHPCFPKSSHQTPQQRKNYPPIIQSTPRLQKTIDTQVKPVFPTSIGSPPPPQSTDASKTPPTRAGSKRTHQPMHSTAHQTRPKPPRPSRNPNPEAKRPQNRKPTLDLPRNSTAARPATYVRRHRHPQQLRIQLPEKQHQNTIQARIAAPAPDPPKETHPQGTPRCPQPI